MKHLSYAYQINIFEFISDKQSKKKLFEMFELFIVST